jgi:hypothetical protein
MFNNFSYENRIACEVMWEIMIDIHRLQMAIK